MWGEKLHNVIHDTKGNGSKSEIVPHLEITEPKLKLLMVGERNDVKGSHNVVYTSATQKAVVQRYI